MTAAPLSMIQVSLFISSHDAYSVALQFSGVAASKYTPSFIHLSIPGVTGAELQPSHWSGLADEFRQPWDGVRLGARISTSRPCSGTRLSTSIGYGPNWTERRRCRIPPKQNRKRTIECDFAMYGWRHLIENFFCDIKEIPPHRNPIRQDRLQLQRHDLSRQLNHRIAMNVHNP